MVLTFLCVFAILSCSIESRADAEHLLRLLIGAAILLATVAVAQAWFGNGKFLWVYEHPSRSADKIPRGPFQNENHLSSLLATTLPIALLFLFCSRTAVTGLATSRLAGSRGGWWTEYFNLKDQLLAAIAIIAIITTVLLTPSRGGACVIVGACLLWGGIVAWEWIAETRMTPSLRWIWLQAGMLAGILSITLFAVLLYNNIEPYSYWRARIWSVAVQIWRDFPVFGIGAGTHRFTYRSYFGEYYGKTFSAAESSWLHILEESGLAGFLTAAAICLLVLWTLLKVMRDASQSFDKQLSASLIAGLVISCLHAVGDFPWHIPACLVVVISLAVVGSRLHAINNQATNSDSFNQRRIDLRGSLIAACCTFGLVWSIVQTTPRARGELAWDAYQRLTKREAHDTSQSQSLQKEHLNQAIRHDPGHVLARTKHAAMMLADLQALELSDEERRKRAVAVIRQAAEIALRCPTESRPYFFAALALESINGPLERRRALLERAQVLRPVDGRVALKLALCAMMVGNTNEVHRQFAIALERDPVHIETVVETMTLVYSHNYIVQTWQPSSQVANFLYRNARASSNPEDAEFVAQYLIERYLQEAEMITSYHLKDRHLRQAVAVAAEHQFTNWLIQILDRRIALQPGSVELYLQRAEALLEGKKLELAKRDWFRCQELAPSETRVRELGYRIESAILQR